MVDAGADKVDLWVGDADPAGQHFAGALHTVAEPHVRASAAVGHGPAVGRHRVDIVEQQRVGGQHIQVVAQVEQHRDGAQRTKDPAWPQRIADTLFDAIFLGDLDIQPVGVEPPLLKGGDHIVCAGDCFLAVGGGENLGFELALVDHGLDDGLCLSETGRVDVHQADRALLQGGGEQDIAAKVAGEDEASRTDQGNLWHSGLRSAFHKSSIGCLRIVCPCATAGVCCQKDSR